MTALLPLSSSKVRPSRCPTNDATLRPTGTEPVKEISGSRSSRTMRSASSTRSVVQSAKTPGCPASSKTRLQRCCIPTAQSGAFGEGFHNTVLPVTAAMNAFQAQTATGKLNAVMTPTTPKGCHCSYIRCCGRSECMVRPYNMRESPTAKSAMSIISCTSPSPSALIFPTSRAIRLPRASFCSLSA